MNKFPAKLICVTSLLLVILSACSSPVSTPPTMSTTASPTTSSSDDASAAYKAFGEALEASKSTWVTYYQAQDSCLPLSHKRGNLQTFKSCIDNYRFAFKGVLKSKANYLAFLNAFTPPSAMADEFQTYRKSVARTNKRLDAMFEVFCIDEPHSTLDWYNCVGSSDVSEAWDRYYLIQDKEKQNLQDLSNVLSQQGYPITVNE